MSDKRAGYKQGGDNMDEMTLSLSSYHYPVSVQYTVGRLGQSSIPTHGASERASAFGKG